MQAGSWGIILGWSIDGLMIVLNFRVDTSENKTLTIITSLIRDLATSNALNYSFYPFYCNLKEKDNIRKI